MSYRLRKPLLPEADESLGGLIARNADRLHFRHPNLLLHRINPPGQVIWSLCEADPEKEFGTRLRNLLGIENIAVFRRMSPWTGDPTTWSIMGQSVWRELVNPESRAACPLCLQENVYHRSTWFIRAMPVCAIHGVWLRTKCHVCERPFTWNRSAHQLCSGTPLCRADVRNAPIEPAPESALAAIRALHALAHADSGSPNSGPFGLGFAETLKLSFLLGQIAHGFERASRPPGFMQRHASQVPDVVTTGWNALDDWPHGFHRLLDQLREKAAERNGKDGLRKAFGTLSAKVYHWAREPWGAPIGQAFAQYAASQGDLATTAWTLKRYSPGAELRHIFITTAEAQRALGLSGQSILRLARRRNLFELPPRGAGLPSLLRADVFRKIVDEAGDFMLPEQARRELGVGRKVMEQLEAAGLIRRSPKSQLVLESMPYRRSEIKAFVNSCLRVPPKLARQMVPERKLSTIASVTVPGRTVVDTCRALTDGRIHPVALASSRKGLMRARLLLADVERVLPSSKGTLSLLDAAKQLGIDYSAVYHWSKQGLLKTTLSEGAEEHGRRIDQGTWAQFQSEFITSGMLAKEVGQGANHWISRHLRFLGVEPVSGKDIDGGITMLFRRSDIGPAVIKALRRLQKGMSGSPQEKHRQSFARAKRTADAVAEMWGSRFTRHHNLFLDTQTGRALQVVSGRRPDLTGVFIFHLRTRTLEALHHERDPWIALVPNDGDRFLLVPADQVPWRGGQGADLETRYVSLKFDGSGRPLELAEWAQSLPTKAKVLRVTVAGPRGRRSFDRVVQAATAIEHSWGAKLDRNRNAFVDPSRDRKLHVICGRSCGGPTKQIFNIRQESFVRLQDAAEAWVALVPDSGPSFVLAPIGQLQWCGNGGKARHIRMRFDAHGIPMDVDGMCECSVLTISSKDPS